jgi:hypothetical protein
MARRVAIVLGMAAAGVMALGGLLAATASAADSIYWSVEKPSESIRYGLLTGDNGGSTPAQTLFDDDGLPCGIALDPAAGKIYWATWAGGEIRVANLDGTGTASTLFAAPGNHLCGVAVDPTAGKIYWANFSTNEIRVGNLDGTGASTLFTDPGGSSPSGVAIDPSNNKIYWTNQDSDQVRAGNLDGSGTAQTLFSGEDNPIGVAADPAAGKIYWTDLNSGTVRVGPLGGSTVGVAQTLFNSAVPSGPAIDPTANKIYWASWTSGMGIRVGNLNGTGTASALFGGESSSLFAALLKEPVNTTRPEISGGAKVGRELTCENGRWAPDLLASFLFRAPASFAYQWKRNGSNIATGPTFTPNLAGDYTCTVTATNQAGSTSQTSSEKKVRLK